MTTETCPELVKLKRVQTPASAGNTPGAWPNLCERFDMSDAIGWRTCPRCGETKPPTEFYSDGRQAGRTRLKRRLKCRQCTRAQMRARYADRSAAVDDYKTASGCVDCGWNEHPRALEFDHLPGNGKRFNISAAIAQLSVPMAEIFAEIAKCDLVCANCHRIRTYDREYSNTSWDLRYSSRSADEVGATDDDPPFEQLTLEV